MTKINRKNNLTEADIDICPNSGGEMYKSCLNKYNIEYYGFNSLFEEYISNCPLCIQSSRTIHRIDPVKSINVDVPNIRYEFDLTYLNNDLSKAYGVKMILSIIDVFSRKAMIYGVNNKKSENLIKNILEFCANNSFPKEFWVYIHR